MRKQSHYGISIFGHSDKNIELLYGLPLKQHSDPASIQLAKKEKAVDDISIRETCNMTGVFPAGLYIPTGLTGGPKNSIPGYNE